MRRYAHLGVLTAMIHDLTAGSVRPDGELGVSIDYWPDAADRAELAHGLWACAKLLFAAGAREVFVPTSPEYSFLASSLVKEVATFGGDVSGLVPPHVLARLTERLGAREA